MIKYDNVNLLQQHFLEIHIDHPVEVEDRIRTHHRPFIILSHHFELAQLGSPDDLDINKISNAINSQLVLLEGKSCQ